MGMVKDHVLWAGEVRFLNDAQELGYFGSLIHNYCLPREEFATGCEREVYGQLIAWTKIRFIDGPFVFAASLTENGNLLSQWRGYCQHGRGVSLGFDPALIAACAQGNGFLIGKCIYDSAAQTQIAGDVVTLLQSEAAKRGPDSGKHSSQSYWTLFTEFESEILTIAALVKHPSFAEECEWRCVSRPVSNYVEAPIHYRPGKSTLIPYLNFPLPVVAGGLAVGEVVIGPSANLNLMHKSVSSYLAKYAMTHQHRIIRSSGSPYQG
jgi:hypothetical protein